MTADQTRTGAALEVEDLKVVYTVRGIDREVLRGVSFSVAPGEAYGLVGESGCGKSTCAFAAVRYLPRNGRIVGGHVRVGGRDVTSMSQKDLQDFRAREASMVYQDPAQALNPTLRIGAQVTESFLLLGQKKAQARASALEALRKVRIADPERVMDRYPFQLSGGMQQRVVIAMALACNPKLLVLDEPTTGLDATVEAEVLDLVRVLRQESDAAVVMIAHNLGIIRSLCDRVGVMYAGRIVEEGPSGEVFDSPRHPYTVGLLRSLPRHGAHKTESALATIPGILPQIGTPLPTCVYVDRCPLADDVCQTQVPPKVPIADRGGFALCHHSDRIPEVEAQLDAVQISVLSPSDDSPDVLELSAVSKTFHQRGHDIPALVGVDLTLAAGDTLGIVGESGSGKSTLAKTILGIEAVDDGGVVALDGSELAPATNDRSADSKRAMQMVFQNPDSALNRSWSVRRILVRSMQKLTGIGGEEANTKVEALAAHLRLTPRHLDLKPRQLSGGLKQRVAIARAFAGDPRIVVCDEPTSALDVSVQAAILNLLASLQSENKTSYVFITHDMGVVRYLADRIAVMYLGRIMEIGSTDQIFDDGPNHPYTEALLSAVPSVDGEVRTRIPLAGEVPSPANPPAGCVFHTRCHRLVAGLCDVTEPEPIELAPGHLSRCHLDAATLAQPVKPPASVSG
ncbi:MAG: dipeptide ABC transporter ATP-binding protein [Acidimicrobiia bacterium]|nr:dipeptide ABC transporter ATP-binding protein [Acidimicrobiia bacterium]